MFGRPRAVAHGVLGLFAALALALPFPLPVAGGPGSPPAPVPPASWAGSPAALSPRPATGFDSLSVNTTTVPLAPTFFGTTTPVVAPVPRNESDLIAASPARTIVWPGGGFGDLYDPIADRMYRPGAPPAAPPSNESDFVALCRSVACSAIVELPGEINSTATAAAIVRYTERSLGFVPAYWAVGNEPGRWTHFGIPWVNWSVNDHARVTPAEYAAEVVAYASAVRSVDPSARLLGFSGTGTGAATETQWLAAVASAAGAVVDGFAIHVYPGGLSPATAPSEAQFLAPLTGPNSIPRRLPADRAAIDLACPACAAKPIFATELGSYVLNGSVTPLVGGFPDALFLGAEVVQAVEQNLSSIEYFAAEFTNPGSWQNGSGPIRPVYLLYADLLSHLGPSARTVLGNGSVWGVEGLLTNDPAGRSDLLLVNTDPYSGVQFDPANVPGLTGRAVESWTWDGTTAAPVARFWPSGLPAVVDDPAGGLLLLESYGGSAHPLALTATGAGLPRPWYVTVGGTTVAGLAGPTTLYLPDGTYPLVGPPFVALPNRGREGLLVPAEVTVGANASSLSLPFVEQYRLAIAATGIAANRSWSVLLNGSAVAIHGAFWEDWVDNGTHPFRVVPPPGYAPNVSAGTVAVRGGPARLAVAFSPAPPGSGGGPGDWVTALSNLSALPPIAAGLLAAAFLVNFRRRTASAGSARTGPRTERPRAPERPRLAGGAPSRSPSGRRPAGRSPGGPGHPR